MMRRAVALAPVLEMNEGEAAVLALAGETETGNVNHVLDFRLRHVILFNLLEYFLRACLRCANRQLNHVDEIALVFFRQK